MIDVMQTMTGYEKFTVDTTGPLSVTATQDSAKNIFSDALGFQTFAAGDIVRCLTIGLVYPQSFVPLRGTSTFNALTMTIGFYNVAGVLLADFTPGGFNFVWPNYEVVINQLQTYIPAVPFKLRITSHSANCTKVSMVGVPAALNTQIYEVSFMAKIEHTLALT